MGMRDYGYGQTNEPTGKPVAIPMTDKEKATAPTSACPNCGCEQLMMIQVEVKNDLVKGGKGMCVYVGCPACPFASRAVTYAVGG